MAAKKTAKSAKDRILDAAFSAFMQHGFAGTSTLEIASRAKVSKRRLYANFRGKEAMFAAGVAARMRDVRIAFTFPEAASRAALEKALADMGIAALTAVTHPYVLAVHRLVIAELPHSPAFGIALDEQGRAANRRGLSTFLRKAQAGGLLPGGDADEMAELYLALLWTDLFPRLLLGATKRPGEQEISKRANRAARAFLALYDHKAN